MKMSRRAMLATSAAAVAAPLLGSSRSGSLSLVRQSADANPSTFTINVQNNTKSDTVYAFVTGNAIDNNNALTLLRSDGKTPYYPASPSAAGSPLGADCAIALNGSGGAPKTITVPHMGGARLWFSIGKPMTFTLNPGPALVEPSVTNSSDPNNGLQWDFAEFTYDSTQLYANISMVDFVCIPVALSLTDASGGVQNVAGLPPGGLDTVCSGLTKQQAADGHQWSDLIVAKDGQNLRALSPQNGLVANPSFLSGYYDNYVSQVWSKYASAPLKVDTQTTPGTVTGQVSGDKLTFGGAGSFARPSTADIFSCSTGPFSTGGASTVVQAIIPRLAAAFNRSTLLIDSNQPDGENPAHYYADAVTNHYARIVHATTKDGRGYSFPYDDVAPNGGTDQSGKVNSGNPAKLSITLGPVR